MDQVPQNSASTMPYAHLEELLKQNLELTQENHKILKRMERNALIGFIAKIVIWLLLLGVPLFLLSTYLAPLMAVFTHSSTGTPSGLLGLPSAEQLKQIMETYRAQK